jgi:D-serine deaminase-like pyridoxal phosphate-dependent protein
MLAEEVPTPAFLVDLDRMERNLASWQTVADKMGKKLRPHVKTHKIPSIAHQQVALGACGIAAAKPSEAEVFVDAGIDDVVVAYPTVGADKWAAVARMAKTARVAVNVDSDVEADGLSAAAQAEDVEIGAHIEIDTGLHRVGLAPEQYDEILTFAKRLRSLGGVEFQGITTHRGKFDDRLAQMTNDEAGREEGQILVDLAERLRADGVPVAEVTAGGTITGRGVAQVAGITEIRAGTYVFYDAMQVAYGAATLEEVAVSILTTVVSTRRPGWATVDAGSKTFSGDRAVVGNAMAGADAVARGVGIEADVMRITEEHGMVQLRDGAGVEIGQKLRFVPYHVCTAVNLSEELVAVREGVVDAVWPVAARGRRT